MPASPTKLMASKLLGARAKAQIAKLLPGLGKIDPTPLGDDERRANGSTASSCNPKPASSCRC